MDIEIDLHSDYTYTEPSNLTNLNPRNYNHLNLSPQKRTSIRIEPEVVELNLKKTETEGNSRLSINKLKESNTQNQQNKPQENNKLDKTSSVKDKIDSLENLTNNTNNKSSFNTTSNKSGVNSVFNISTGFDLTLSKPQSDNKANSINFDKKDNHNEDTKFISLLNSHNERFELEKNSKNDLDINIFEREKKKGSDAKSGK